MKTLSSKKRVPDWLIGVCLTLLFSLTSYTGIDVYTDGVEKKTFDIRSKLTASKKRNSDIEIVAITNEDLTEIGPLPWPRNIIAEGINNLAMAGAKVIALNMTFAGPEINAGLKTVVELKKVYRDLGLYNQSPSAKTFYDFLGKAEANLDNDTKLVEVFKKSGNIILPVLFDTSTAKKNDTIADYIRKNFHKTSDINGKMINGNIMRLSNIKPLLPTFANAAAGLGHMNLFPDSDGCIRNQIHTIAYLDNTIIHSFPIAIIQAFKDLKVDQINIISGEGITIPVSPSKILKIPTAGFNMTTLISWNDGPGIAFHTTPFGKVLKKEFHTSLFRDKIVIVGPEVSAIGDMYVTPISDNLPGTEIIANSVSNILNQRFFKAPPLLPYIELIVIILFGLYIAFIVPRLTMGVALFLALALFFSLWIAGTILFYHSNIWLKIAPQMILLILGHVLLFLNWLLSPKPKKEAIATDSFATDKALALSYYKQGLLDLALEKIQRYPVDDQDSKDLLYNIGLDYEKDGQTPNALKAYNLIVKNDYNYKDVSERIIELESAESTIILDESSSYPKGIESKSTHMDITQKLGKYKIIDKLGRGAMGIVYKAEDPETKKPVAIKALKLSEYDDKEIHKIKERFFSEAKSARELRHPNIVSILDTGEEQKTAYIVMEYLEGNNLIKFTQRENLLPLRQTLDIASQIAGALDYAHRHKIIHRDIKPANIMLLKGTNQIKVMDFGVARNIPLSTTKTGVILGTPSYMSPEQVSGKKLDGRSDIFSLGVVLFEMLTGTKPFVSDNVTSTMHQIVRKKHLPASEINKKIPHVVEKILDRALEKDITKRYQRAGLMAEHLKKVVERIDQLRKKLS